MNFYLNNKNTHHKKKKSNQNSNGTMNWLSYWLYLIEISVILLFKTFELILFTLCNGLSVLEGIYLNRVSQLFSNFKYGED